MRWLVVGALLLLSCKKEGPLAAKDLPGGPAVMDGLWKLAPEGATGGFVLSPRGLGMIESGVHEFKKLADRTPELAVVAEGWTRDLRSLMGMSETSLAAAGMSASKGVAVFFVGKETDESRLVLTPVVDRDRFLRIAKGHKGANGDTVGTYTCKTVGAFYACAKPAALLETIGKGALLPKVAIAGTRGDAELVVGVPAEGDRAAVEIVLATEITPGALVVRGGVTGVPETARHAIVAAGKQIDPSKLAAFMILNAAPVLAKLPVPDTEVVPGLTLSSIARSISGAITVSIEPAGESFDARVPMADAAAAQQIVDSCPAIAQLAMVTATVADGMCLIAPPELPSFAAWADGSVVRVGMRSPNSAPTSIAVSPIASELANGEWAFAMYGRGSLLGGGLMPPLPPGPLGVTAVRLMSLFSEGAIGVRVDGDKLRVLLAVRTLWSNPDAVLRKLLVIPTQDIIAGKGPEAGRSIATSHPDAPFATDYKAGISGLLIPAGAGAMLMGFVTTSARVRPQNASGASWD